MQELMETRGGVFKTSANVGGGGRRKTAAETLFATTDADRLAECEHMLLYLKGLTWTRGEASEALAEDERRARKLGVHVLLTPESTHGTTFLMLAPSATRGRMHASCEHATRDRTFNSALVQHSETAAFRAAAEA